MLGSEPSWHPTSSGPAVRSTTVLLAPGACIWKAGAGSENGWLFEVVEGLADAGYAFEVVAEEADGSGSQRSMVALGRRRIASLGGFALPFRVAASVVHRRMLASVDVVHHGMPFGVGRTFSLLPRMAARRGIPFVLGPVQVPQTWTGPDETWANLDGVANAKLRARVEVAIESGLGAFAGRILGRFSDSTLRAAAAVVATGPTAADLLARRGVPTSRVRVIHPSVGKAFFGERVRTGLCKRPVVLTGGVLIERKGVDEVIEAFARLHRSGSGAHLLVYGDGPRRELLVRQVSRLGLERCVTFLGWVSRDNLPDLLGAVDLFVSMSRSESWGGAVAEAMASGVVVLSAANVGAKDQIRPGENGLLVEIGDVDGCERGLRLLLGDADLRERLAAAGARWARGNVHPEVVMRDWDQLYRDVLEWRDRTDPTGTPREARRGKEMTQCYDGERGAISSSSDMPRSRGPLVAAEPAKMTPVLSKFRTVVGMRSEFANWYSPALALMAERCFNTCRPISWHSRRGTKLVTLADGSSWPVREIFIQDDYRLGDLGVNDISTVIDIGSNIG
ncbi:MAG: glycosyltransferase family 4 protein, partial [Acidimicrobiales bacterium]